MAKKRNKKYRGGVGFGTGVAYFEKRLFMNSTEDISQERIDALVNPLAIQLTALQFGTLDLDGYYDIHQQMMFTYHLALNIHEHGDTETKAIIAPYGEMLDGAAQALSDVGKRYASTKRFVAKADEINSLRGMVPALEGLLSVATVGIATQANVAAKRDIEKERKRLAI